MSVGEDDLTLLACLYNKAIIGSNHRMMVSIADLCHIIDRKDLNMRLKRLVELGYLNKHHGSGYSLTKSGVRAAQEHLGIRPREP